MARTKKPAEAVAENQEAAVEVKEEAKVEEKVMEKTEEKAVDLDDYEEVKLVEKKKVDHTVYLGDKPVEFKGGKATVKADVAKKLRAEGIVE